jgi:hypothetical protein
MHVSKNFSVIFYALSDNNYPENNRGSTPNPGKLLKKLDQNISREKSQIFHIEKFLALPFFKKVTGRLSG